MRSQWRSHKEKASCISAFNATFTRIHVCDLEFAVAIFHKFVKSDRSECNHISYNHVVWVIGPLNASSSLLKPPRASSSRGSTHILRDAWWNQVWTGPEWYSSLVLQRQSSLCDAHRYCCTCTLIFLLQQTKTSTLRRQQVLQLIMLLCVSEGWFSLWPSQAVVCGVDVLHCKSWWQQNKAAPQTTVTKRKG